MMSAAAPRPRSSSSSPSPPPRSPLRRCLQIFPASSMANMRTSVAPSGRSSPWGRRCLPHLRPLQPLSAGVLASTSCRLPPANSRLCWEHVL
eukprot:351856-Chlamydomonas_euryale.AAC.5